MEEGKDHYLGEVSKREIREELVCHLELGFVGAEGRERAASVVDRMIRGGRREPRRGFGGQTSALSRAMPSYGPQP
jgi:hypothetical protein